MPMSNFLQRVKLPIRKTILVAIFGCYLGSLFIISLCPYITGSGAVQTHLFSAFWSAWNNFTFRCWIPILLNIGIFVPIGAILPLVARPFQRWYITIPIGFGCSLFIEIIQYLMASGISDVDDLFCNTIGTALGYCLCMIVFSASKQKSVMCIAYGMVPLISVGVMVCVLVLYKIQPYGNLLDGPTFRADTSFVTQWEINCPLSDQRQEVEIYYTEPFNTENGFAFARKFAEQQGKTIRNISDYGDTIYIQDPDGANGFSLMINLADPSYTYRDNRHFMYESADWDNGQIEESVLQNILLEFGIFIPEQAVMSYDGNGQYAFDVDMLVDGNTCIFGTVCCWMNKDRKIMEIENSMSVGTLYATESILSETEAYERLRQGRFSNGHSFEDSHYNQIQVLSCQLEYEMDTKGFLQPVYHFELDKLGPVTVPALVSYWGP